MRLRRSFCIVSALLLLLYVGSFVCLFEVFGYATRNNSQGWLGPHLRGDKSSQDIGAVYYYESDDLSFYHVYWPLCKLWLFAQGLS